MAQPNRQGDFNGFAFLASGFVLVFASLGGYVVGYLIDKALGTFPRWAIVGLLIGTVVGFWDLYQTAMRLINQPTRPAPPRDDKKNFSEERENGKGFREENHEED